jgi:hypothetical protein
LNAELAAARSKYQDETIRSVRTKRIQCDEIWSFVGSKEKNTSFEKKKVNSLRSAVERAWANLAAHRDSEHQPSN